jgi:predicted lipoprotein with Yx(FWY)xxD motif
MPKNNFLTGILFMGVAGFALYTYLKDKNGSTPAIYGSTSGQSKDRVIIELQEGEAEIIDSVIARDTEKFDTWLIKKSESGDELAQHVADTRAGARTGDVLSVRYDSTKDELTGAIINRDGTLITASNDVQKNLKLTAIGGQAPSDQRDTFDPNFIPLWKVKKGTRKIEDAPEWQQPILREALAREG